jgi:hypothetical protein
MSRNDIKNNTNNTLSLKSNRADRDSKLEVTLPDGTKLIRRPVEHLGKREGKLSIPPKQGFERRWVKNETPSNLQNYIDLGWVPATDIDGVAYEPIKGGHRKNGTEYKLYPLEIPTKEFERIREKNKINNPESLLGAGDVQGVGIYKPTGANTSFEKDITSPRK